MENYQFDQWIDRCGSGSLKGEMTPAVLREAGLPSFWGAEFDFPTCPAFSEGVLRCVQRGAYHFTLQTAEYNERVLWWMKHLRDWDIEPDWIIPTHGTIFSLATAIRLLLPPEKRLIILQPGYSRYEQAATRLGHGCSHCYMLCDPATGCYRLDRAALEQAMADPSNGLLVFSNPNNPTGYILSEEELWFVDELSRKYDMPVFCDEIFAETVRNGASVTPYGKVARQESKAITCTSLGKCMSLTGVNHANVLIPNETLRQRFVEQRNADHYGSIDPMLYAGLLSAYSPEGKDFVDALNRVTGANFAYFKENLERILPGCRVTPSDATYLAWVDYRGTGMDAATLAQKLDAALFVGDPGEEYHADAFCYRYSLAMPPQMLKKALNYLETHL